MKYLGLYVMEYLSYEEAIIVPIKEEAINTDEYCNYYNIDDFMSIEKTKKYPFDGTLCLSNSGGIVLKIIDYETFKLWRV